MARDRGQTVCLITPITRTKWHHGWTVELEAQRLHELVEGRCITVRSPWPSTNTFCTLNTDCADSHGQSRTNSSGCTQTRTTRTARKPRTRASGEDKGHGRHGLSRNPRTRRQTRIARILPGVTDPLFGFNAKTEDTDSHGRQGRTSARRLRTKHGRRGHDGSHGHRLGASTGTENADPLGRHGRCRSRTLVRAMPQILGTSPGSDGAGCCGDHLRRIA